ncbi:MAG: hypothetical protein GC204_03135 [Chloroflexi bacterium]|nr:hypothetical protein [Chloroflexota bacterium]
MFDFEKNVLGAREHHRELMREAEARRLAHKTKPQQPELLQQMQAQLQNSTLRIHPERQRSQRA